MKYQIAGKIWLFKNNDSRLPNEILLQLLEFYQESDDVPEEICVVFVNKPLDNLIEYRNPKIHGELKNGFVIPAVYGQVAYSKETDIPVIKVYLSSLFYKNTIFSRVIINGEFSSLRDKLSAVLYETIIIPSTFFFADLGLIHSTGVFNQKEQGILLGGTGGIGKTSMEIELCFYNKYHFLNDDIGIIDTHGYLYPNYAFPKIYGYNFDGYSEFKQMVFSNRSILDKFAWYYKKTRNGIHRVRRKISPELFHATTKNHVKLNTYFLLSRHQNTEFKINTIEPTTAAIHTQNIIQTEYADFFNHLSWHQYNTEMTGRKPVIDLIDYKNNQKQLLVKAFSSANIYSVLIPNQISHKEYLKTMKSIIENHLS
ncbi:MAG: hypothetical protein AB7E36_03010 [Salinivirgaceae bacterium]